MDLPNEEALRWIVQTYARLRAGHGEGIGQPELVQPTGAFFSDEFRGDAPSVARLLRRMIDLAPLSTELGVELAFIAPDEQAAGGCGSGACGSPGGGPSAIPVQELENGYRVVVSTNDVGNAEVLTTALARSVGSLVLHEVSEIADAESSEMAAVACGFGVLLLNGAAVWAKSCGGLRVAQATARPVEEIAVALALFGSVHGTRPSLLGKHLGVTQRAALDAAQDWVDSNPSIAEALRDAPHRLATGVLEFEPTRGVLGQWWHRRKLEQGLRAAPSAAAATSAMSDDRRRRLQEVRALMDGADDEPLTGGAPLAED
ncbi:MAG TPA: hypothetical protein VH044_10035 [Polyangiaceae bacterium]|nr:hypothetical protein [Polyangiaceae bacterium]